MTAAAMPILQLRSSNGGAWCVHAKFPDGSVEEIGAFATENEANEWIAKDLENWLDQREDKKKKRKKHAKTEREGGPGASHENRKEPEQSKPHVRLNKVLSHR